MSGAVTDPGGDGSAAWPAEALAAIDGVEEIHVRTRRRDGSLRSPRIIWAVTDGGRVIIRSANGRDAQWFRWAIATGSAQLVVRGQGYDVALTEVDDEPTLAAADAGYQAKYGRRYAGIVASLNGPGPRAATLLARPA